MKGKKWTHSSMHAEKFFRASSVIRIWQRNWIRQEWF